MLVTLSLELVPGAVIAGRYQLERHLGQGGMGTVWAATHTITRKRLALKFLRGPAHLRPELRKRFLREARAACAVSHPNLLEVNDVFDLDDGTPVMVMALLDGETLGKRLAREGRLSLEETADVLIQVVAGVGTAHASGIVHRDLKPENVFLLTGSDGARSVRVLDFGIAKLVDHEDRGEGSTITGTGSMLGTPAYMSPEQTYGQKDVDNRSDIWALGVMLYECLSGGRPIEGDSVGQIVKRLLSEGIAPIEVVVPGLPKDVAELASRMLRRERDERPRDLREVSAVLARYTSIHPADFGPAYSATVPDSGAATPSSPAELQAPSGHQSPETASTHAVSGPSVAKRPPAAIWTLLAMVVVGASLFALSRSSATPPPSSSVAPRSAQPTSSTGADPAAGVRQNAPAPAVAPVAEPATFPQSSSTVEEYPKASPSSAPMTKRTSAASGAKPRAAVSTTPAGSRPIPSTTTMPAATAEPPAAPLQQGGLLEKPPF